MKLPILNPKLDEKSKRIALFLVIFGCFLSNTLNFNNLLKENRRLEIKNENALTALSYVQKQLYAKNNENISLNSTLKNERDVNLNFGNQIEGIKSTVGVLEKLSKTDSELLKKYSKVYFLNENYIPEKLSIVDPRYLLEKGKVIQVHSDISPYLQKMLDEAESANVPMKILSAYRSFSIQSELKSAYKITYGSGANKFSADQGYSEHQLGTTVDLTTTKTGAVLTGFEKTESYKWLLENAYKYGFIISYPKENSFYIFEPWHWRFVGLSLAQTIHDRGLNFYSMDQREIDQYLISIFD
ncbi:MAG TPA: M15 family metallopeptidase [Candidatus Paceibacterota bacterium]